MLIPFCQLLEKAVDRNDLIAVEILCAAYQTIFNIAAKKTGFAALPAVLLLPVFHARLLGKALNQRLIFAELNKIKAISAPIAAKDQKTNSELGLKELVAACQAEKNSIEIAPLVNAIQNIETVSNDYQKYEAEELNKKVEDNFPYIFPKQDLHVKIIGEIRAWYFDKRNYHDDYILAMVFKVIDSEMLDANAVFKEVQKIVEDGNVTSKKPILRQAEKIECLQRIINKLNDDNAVILMAKLKEECTQDVGVHANNALKAIQALKVRFGFIKSLPHAGRFAVVVGELNMDLQNLPEEYLQYDEGGELAQIKQQVRKMLTEKPVPADTKTTKTAVADTKAYRGPIPRLFLTVSHDTAAQQKEQQAFAEELLIKPGKAASAGSTAVVDTSTSRPAAAFVAFGGPS